MVVTRHPVDAELPQVGAPMVDQSGSSGVADDDDQNMLPENNDDDDSGKGTMCCSTEGCANTIYARGMCRHCYDKQWRRNRPLVECFLCHRERPVHVWKSNRPFCVKCYASEHIATCIGCGHTKRVAKRLHNGYLCYNCYQEIRIKIICSICGDEALPAVADPPICHKCYASDYNEKPTTVARKAVFLAKRRAAEIEGNFTSADWLNLMRLWDWECAYCGERLKRGTRSTDHIVPLSKGGRNDMDNIVPCCVCCNSSKNDKLLSEWLDPDAYHQVLMRMAEIGGRNDV
jgi:5-methylcytosine-specific restriction endonuclease McrA